MSDKIYKYIIFCVFCVTLYGCVTEKKASKFLDKKPEFAAKECARRFPIKETIDTVTVLDTTLLMAYEMEFGYLYSVIDSLLGDKVDAGTKKEIVTVFQERKVPVIKYKYITRTQESTAKCQVILDSMKNVQKQLDSYIESLTAEKQDYGKKYMEVNEKADKYRSQRNKLYWWILLLLLILFRNPIFKGFAKLVTK